MKTSKRRNIVYICDIDNSEVNVRTKSTIPNKMVSFRKQKNDFQFFTKVHQQKFNIVRVKVEKNNFAITRVQTCTQTNLNMLDTMVLSKRR